MKSVCDPIRPVIVILLYLVINGHCFPHPVTETSGVTELFTDAADQLYKCKYPDHFEVRLNLSGQAEVSIVLKKDDAYSNRFAPTYLLSRLARRDAGVESLKMDFVRYTSTSPDSHILVECKHLQKSRYPYVSGIILYKGIGYMIQSIKPEDTAKLRFIFVRWQRIPDSLSSHNYTVSESSRLPSDQKNLISSRERRDVIGNGEIHTFTVNVLVVVDYNVYLKWLSRADGGSGKENSVIAKNEIQRYYHHVINGVDLRYRSIGFTDFQIRVNLSGIIIIDKNTSFADQDSESNHTQTPKTNQTSEMDADTALKVFRSWINDTSGLPEHNHAILFTGYDLFTTNENGERISHTSGLAFIGTLCEPSDSVSLVEEQGGFQSIGTAAHEIGHSLGALHDGENNTCHSEDRYIMAASGFGPVPEEKKYNPWIFSQCTIEYFRNYITSLLISKSNCMANKKSSLTSEKDLKEEKHLSYPGQYYSPDEQCRQIWGPTSYLCRGAEFGNASSICTAMYCRDPSTESDCVLHTAARGTSCGNKQWCMNGYCVYSQRAPRRQEPCVLGDQPGPAFNSMTCEELISESPSYCYQEKVRARCCNTCWAKYTYRKGCEYGDRIQGCRSWHCSHFFQSRDIRKECCGTCGIGEFVTPPNLEPLYPTQAQLSTTVSTNWSPGLCMDTGMFSGLTCPEYINSRGAFVCYNNMTVDLCCQSCRQVHREVESCEYGDRVPSLCDVIKNKTELTCSKYGDYCCSSCVPYTDSDISDTNSAFHPVSFSVYNIIITIISFVFFR